MNGEITKMALKKKGILKVQGNSLCSLKVNDIQNTIKCWHNFLSRFLLWSLRLAGIPANSSTCIIFF